MIDTAALGFALGAGLVAALNPCGFALLPGYLGLVVAGGAHQSARQMGVARALAATAAMSAGFLTVFGVFGLVISPLVSTAQRYVPFATVVIGVSLVAAGLWLLAGKDLRIALPRPAGGVPTGQLGSMYGYGLAYAIASLSCTIAPFLAVISITFKHGSALTGVLAFLAYAAGMTTTVGLAALAVALFGRAGAGIARRILPYAGRIAGALVLLTGLYVTYYGCYEIRLFFANASPADPVVEAAGAVQGWLVQGVDRLGVWPLLAAVMVVAVGALARRAVTRRHAQRP